VPSCRRIILYSSLRTLIYLPGIWHTKWTRGLTKRSDGGVGEVLFYF
jgi:hypothetical protein